MTRKVWSRIMSIYSCVWCRKITNMRCSIWWLRVTDRIASSSMANSPIHRQCWIHILQISCRWIKRWNTFLYAIGNFNMRCFRLISQTHHVVHRHMDLWGCRCMGVWIHMLYVAKIVRIWSMKIVLHRPLRIITCMIDKTRASRYIMLIRWSSNNIWIICIYKGELGIHITFVDCSNLMTISS